MSRQEQITNLQCFLKDVDKDITMILQNLQWDRSSLSKEQPSLTKCKYDENHKVSSSKLKEHEEKCFLKQNGYSAEDVLLPDLLNTDAPTVVKFNSNDIKKIIDNAAEKDPLFKRVSHDLESTYSCLWCNSEAVQPLTVERLQSTYTADERRAIHDAVVSSVRTVQEHEEFVFLSGESGAAVGEKSLLEQLAEQRDRRRRRTKYRAPPKTRNYSLVLRDVICAQMELLNEINGNTEAGPSHTNTDGVQIKKEMEESSKCQSRDNCDNRKYEEDAHKSRHYSEKNSYDYGKRHDKYTTDTERRYEKHNKDIENRKYFDRHSNYNHNDTENSAYKQNKYYNKDTDSRRHYDKSSKDDNKNSESKIYGKSESNHQASRHYKTGDKRGKDDTNTEYTDKHSSRHTKDAYREREKGRRDSSKDINKYKEHRDDKKYKDEFSKSDKRKREYLDKGYTERDRYDSSDRKRGKYEERYDKEKERSYSKYNINYRHRKDE